ncbi:MAG: CAP domain-containing protein [Chloroflexota bacterium]
MFHSFTLQRLRSTLTGMALAAAIATPLGGLLPATLAVHAEGSFAPLDATVSQEMRVIELVNADRAAHGLLALEFDPSLASVARWRSEDMAARSYFSHDIGGYQVFQVLRDQGVDYRVAGENLAYNYFAPEETALRAEKSLMESPTHRANILRADYTHVGVGVAVSPDGRYLFTQLFKKAW